MLAIRAGSVYFMLVFATGFAFGIARTLLLAHYPEMDRFTAVLLELPFLLAVSWLVCRFLVRRLKVPEGLSARASMGAVAFILLIIAEAVLDMALSGESIGDHFAHYCEPAYVLGLAGQVAFSLMPLFAGLSGAHSRPRPAR